MALPIAKIPPNPPFAKVGTRQCLFGNNLSYKALVVATCLALSACGFHLRGSGGDNSFAQNLFVEGTGPTGTFISAFASALTGAGGNLSGAAGTSTAIVRLYKASYIRQPITLSRTGRATGFDLIYRISYDVRTPKGEILQLRKEFEAKREYFNDQTLPLAQLSEEGQIREELEKEAAQTLLRNVVTVLKQAPESAPAVPLNKL
jgi:LPS-assembly lipoprotein